MQPDVAGIAEQAKRIATTVVGHHSMATANQVLWLAGHLCYLAWELTGDKACLLELEERSMDKRG